MSAPFAAGPTRSVPGSWPENPTTQSSTQSDASRQYHSDWNTSGPDSDPATSYPSSAPQDVNAYSQQYPPLAVPTRSSNATNEMFRQLGQQKAAASLDKSLAVPVRRPSGSRVCAKCGNSLSGQFVRALDATYHLECFTCHVSY
jgi:LIM domain